MAVMSFDGTIAINPNTYRKLPFDPQRDLAPAASVAQVPLLLVVHPSVAAQTLAEFGVAGEGRARAAERTGRQGMAAPATSPARAIRN